MIQSFCSVHFSAFPGVFDLSDLSVRGAPWIAVETFVLLLSIPIALAFSGCNL